MFILFLHKNILLVYNFDCVIQSRAFAGILSSFCFCHTIPNSDRLRVVSLSQLSLLRQQKWKKSVRKGNQCLAKTGRERCTEKEGLQTKPGSLNYVFLSQRKNMIGY